MNTMSFNMLTKVTRQKEDGIRKMLTELTKGGGGIWEMLALADKGGWGVGEMLTTADKGRGGFWTPRFLADIICEQPPYHKYLNL